MRIKFRDNSNVNNFSDSTFYKHTKFDEKDYKNGDYSGLSIKLTPLLIYNTIIYLYTYLPMDKQGKKLIH